MPILTTRSHAQELVTYFRGKRDREGGKWDLHALVASKWFDLIDQDTPEAAELDRILDSLEFLPTLCDSSEDLKSSVRQWVEEQNLVVV